MMRTWAVLAVASVAFGAEQGPPQSFQTTSQQVLDFQPGGTVRIENSYGYLTVEGWDESKVEIVVTKSTNRFYPLDHEEKSTQAFNQIHVAAELRSAKEAAITTTLPARHSFPFDILPSGRLLVTMPKTSERGVTVEYVVHVPRESSLVVHHDHGYVWVGGVRGDIEVDSHTGDMIVMLPEPGKSSIDAQTRFGSIASDLPGSGNKRILVGSRFVHAEQTPARRILLRMGRGCITIKTDTLSSTF